MRYFDVLKIEKILKEIITEKKIKTTAGVNLVCNNMRLYNGLLEGYLQGETKNLYVMYQMSSTIHKMLKDFGVIPDNKKDAPGNSGVDDFLKSIK